MAHVIESAAFTDYAKKITKAPWFDGGLRKFTVVMTATMFLGLAKLNLQGPGVTESFMSLWRVKKSDK